MGLKQIHCHWALSSNGVISLVFKRGSPLLRVECKEVKASGREKREIDREREKERERE